MSSVTIGNLPETPSISGGDQFPVLLSSNNRTRQVAASDMATYFNQVITGASIQFNTATSVITLTLGNGAIITGTVAP